MRVLGQVYYTFGEGHKTENDERAIRLSLNGGFAAKEINKQKDQRLQAQAAAFSVSKLSGLVLHACSPFAVCVNFTNF